MSKYKPLYFHLKSLSAQGKDSWQATFAQIEEVLGFKLPKSAHEYPAWWANERNIRTHVQKHMWFDAGWKTEDLNLTGRRVSFRKVAA